MRAIKIQSERRSISLPLLFNVLFGVNWFGVSRSWSCMQRMYIRLDIAIERLHESKKMDKLCKVTFCSFPGFVMNLGPQWCCPTFIGLWDIIVYFNNLHEIFCWFWFFVFQPSGLPSQTIPVLYIQGSYMSYLVPSSNSYIVYKVKFRSSEISAT